MNENSLYIRTTPSQTSTLRSGVGLGEKFCGEICRVIIIIMNVLNTCSRNASNASACIPRPPTCEYDCRECSSYHEADGVAILARITATSSDQRLGELGALASTAFAMYEGRKAKVDPEHAQKHQLEAGAGALGAVLSAGYAYNEHRQKNAHNGQRYE
ncbi:hypothetical protein KP509_21G060300 [Ceratopteris richardii]|uniref:Uncharacterized protein n=1 Tax=Ceratopteris richardii TaxID=49495 RepID=A0A8T2SCG9_CERRI|nr:hypothetical protein KP509_21G060300 [Ceratopteris richardii]